MSRRRTVHRRRRRETGGGGIRQDISREMAQLKQSSNQSKPETNRLSKRERKKSKQKATLDNDQDWLDETLQPEMTPDEVIEAWKQMSES